MTCRELLAMVAALWHFRLYMYGQKFLLRTDHSSLTWLLSFKEPEGPIARWLEQLQDYAFTVEHQAGRGAQQRLNGDSAVPRLTLKQLRMAQESDGVLFCILKWVRTGEWSDHATIVDSSLELKALHSQWPCLTVLDRLLYRRWERLCVAVRSAAAATGDNVGAGE